MSWGDDGFAGCLGRDATDLCASAKRHHILAPLFRDDVIKHVCTLLKRAESVLLVGSNGVGKTATLYGVAHALFADETSGSIFELSTADIMSGTKYLGEWETKATTLLSEASEIGGVLYISDIWNLPTTGKAANNPSSLLDLVRPRIKNSKSIFVGEVTPEQLRMLERVPGFSGLFTLVHLEPMSQVEALETIRARAASLELDLDDRALDSVLALPRRFSPGIPAPGNALALLENVKDYHGEKARIGELEDITPAFIERVYSIYSGLPLFIVSPSEKRSAQEIRAWFQERLIGQHEAVEAVVESIALFKAGLNDPKKPLGTFMFVGPTGVGKTELARALATYLFGSVHRMLRFDLSEFTDYSSVERLIGSANDPSRPAQLLDPVRANPFQVILFDEIEKAHPNVWDLLLPLLDDGRLTPPVGRTVDFTNTIVICTSNVGASDAERNLGFSVAGEGQVRDQKIKAKLEEAFRPEFLNRFQHIVVFHALARSQLRRIARQELRDILQRDGIIARNLVVDVNDAAIDYVIDRGFDERYGARALKRELQSSLVMPLAMTLMERAPEAGTLLSVSIKNDQIRVQITDTPESRKARQQERPIKGADGRVHTKASIFSDLSDIQEKLGLLADSVDEPFHLSERERLVELRQTRHFGGTARPLIVIYETSTASTKHLNASNGCGVESVA